MKKPITNYGKLLAEIQYFESIGNEVMADLLYRLLDKARDKDNEKNRLKNLENERMGEQ